MAVRVPSGIAELEVVLSGGFPRGCTSLILGAPGTGKAVHVRPQLLNGLLSCKKGLFITLAEPLVELERSVASFGGGLAGLDSLDLYPLGQGPTTPFEEDQVFSPTEVEKVSVRKRVGQAIPKKKPMRRVLDSMSILRAMTSDPYKAVAYPFEEVPESMVARAKALGILTDGPLRGEKLLFRYVNPLTLYPDEFLAMVRADVEEVRSVVLIESVRGYNLAMEAFGDLVAPTQNLVAFLQSYEVTSFWINETEHITGDLRLTKLSIRYLFDNAFLMSYAEMGVQVGRLIGRLKKRLDLFQTDLREIKFTEPGLWVGEPLTGVTGLLSGHVRPWRPSYDR